MARVRVGINGFGRIGRITARQILSDDKLELVAISDIVPDRSNLAYLYNYDSNYGRAPRSARVAADQKSLVIDNTTIPLFCEPKIANVPWSDCGVDILIDSSGFEANTQQAPLVLDKGGVRNVIVTQSLNAGVDKTIIVGVNDHELDAMQHRVLSSSICDTNAIAHVLKALDSEYGIESGFVTTLHPWLSYQNLVDGPLLRDSQPRHPWTDYSLGRASDSALIPKKTTAVSALQYVLPELAARLKGFSYRTPTAIVCSADLTILLRRDADTEIVKRHLCARFSGSRYVKLNSEPLTSKDYEGDTASIIIDLPWTMVSGNRLLKLVGWYDNEWGYCARLVELTLRLAEGARGNGSSRTSTHYDSFASTCV